MNLTKTQRLEVRNRFGGCCSYCGNPLPDTGWHADHVLCVRRVSEVVLDSKGDRVVRYTGQVERPQNETIDNLFPACAPCNLLKSVYDLEDFRTQIAMQVDRARKYSANFRTAERFGLIEVVTTSIVVFFFERYFPAQNNEM